DLAREECKARYPRAAGGKHLDALFSERSVSDHERAVRRIDRERRRIEHASGFSADLDDLLRGVALNREYGVAAPVEDEVSAGIALLKAHRLPERSNNVRGNATGRLKDLHTRPGRREGADGEKERQQSHDRSPGVNS